MNPDDQIGGLAADVQQEVELARLRAEVERLETELSHCQHDLHYSRRPSPWVPVAERLPPEDAALVIFRGPDCMDDPHVGSFADGDWYCDRLPCIRGDEADHLVTEEITEWTTLPLPTPPDKED